MTKLALGADTVARLIPHRRPFLFLDGLGAFERAPRPTLTGHKSVGANEPVFEGHFPGLSLWPGVYTIEGLGQTVNACLVLLAVLEAFERFGRTEADMVKSLRAIDKRMRLGGRPPTEEETLLLDNLGGTRARIGLAGALDIKLVEPVFAGSRIDYRVTLTHSLDNARRFDVEASVERRRVAHGTLTSALPADL